MAAAEYYTGGPLHTPAPPSPYQQASNAYPSKPPHGKPHSQQPPPPYQAVQQEHRPSVHFAQSPIPSQSSPRPSFSNQLPMPSPQQQHRPSFSNQLPMPSPPQQQQQQHRPSFSNQLPTSSPRPSFSNHLPIPIPQQKHQPSFANQRPSQQYPQPYPQQPNSYHGTPPQTGLAPPRPHYLSQDQPYMNGNHSSYSVNQGYASDPESHRRRHRRHEHRDRHDRDVKDEPRSDRTRSTNADGLLGAAGGGLIGDLIFPGLGTVGGALAGWLGGKDYGKHRKHREDRLGREQVVWERKFRGRSGSDDHREDSRARRSYERHKDDY